MDYIIGACIGALIAVITTWIVAGKFLPANYCKKAELLTEAEQSAKESAESAFAKREERCVNSKTRQNYLTTKSGSTKRLLDLISVSNNSKAATMPSMARSKTSAAVKKHLVKSKAASTNVMRNSASVKKP